VSGRRVVGFSLEEEKKKVDKKKKKKRWDFGTRCCLCVGLWHMCLCVPAALLAAQVKL
jgi:hypothetical protein